MFSKLAATYANQRHYHIRAGAPRIAESSTTAAPAAVAVVTSDNESAQLVSTEEPVQFDVDTSSEYAVSVKFYTADVDSMPELIATTSQHPYATASRCAIIIVVTDVTLFICNAAPLLLRRAATYCIYFVCMKQQMVPVESVKHDL
jgi:hypothetical protein